MVFIYMFILNVGLFFLSIPIPVFIPSDRFAWNGPVRLSFTDRRNSSQARQTPPVGRSEKVRRPTEATGSPIPITGDE